MKRITFAAFALLPAIAVAQTKNTYTLKAKVGNLNAPAKAYLAQPAANGFKVDTAKIVNGSFTFTGVAAEPVSAYLLLDHKGIGYEKLDRSADVLPIYLEKGNITITSADSVAKGVVAGSPVNDDNTKLQASLKESIQKLKQIMARASAATPEQQQSAEFVTQLTADYKAAQAEYKEGIKTFIKTHPDSYLSLLTLKSIAGQQPEPAELGPLYASLSKKLQQSPGGLEFKAALDKIKPTSIGSEAPDFTQADVNGAPVKLSSFRGKYVLVDFWASWCGPCRQENPNVVKAYNKYKDKNFTILGVSLDKESGKAEWLKAIKEDGLTWVQVSDLKGGYNEAAVLYGVQSIPQNYLIGPDGKIIAKNLRGQDLEDKLAELLGKI